LCTTAESLPVAAKSEIEREGRLKSDTDRRWRVGVERCRGYRRRNGRWGIWGRRTAVDPQFAHQLTRGTAGTLGPLVTLTVTKAASG